MAPSVDCNHVRGHLCACPAADSTADAFVSHCPAVHPRTAWPGAAASRDLVRRTPLPAPPPLLPGTLDLLILKAVSLGPLHGYGVLLRIAQISRGAILVRQGALYPALYRLGQRGWLVTEWGRSDNNRRAKFYQLTGAGWRQLRHERAEWQRLAAGISAALAAT